MLVLFDDNDGCDDAVADDVEAAQEEEEAEEEAEARCLRYVTIRSAAAGSTPASIG